MAVKTQTIPEHVHYRRFYQLIETLKVHGQIEYGTDEIDVDAFVNFLESNGNIPRFFNCSDEDVERMVLQDILDGMPVWLFFKLSPWTKKMLQKEHDKFIKEEKKKEEKRYQEALKKYKCLQQCKYYDCSDSSFGVFIRCRCHSRDIRSRGDNSGDNFKYKQKCPNYLKDETKTKKPIYVG